MASRVSDSDTLNKLLNISNIESDGGNVSSDQSSCSSELSMLIDLDSDDESVDDDSGSDKAFTIVDTFLSLDRNTVWIDISKQILLGRQSSSSNEATISAPSPYAISKIKKDSPLSAFKLIFNQKMLTRIVECTNKNAERQGMENFSLDEDELLKLIALVSARGILGLGHVPYNYCWHQIFGPSFFKKCMPRNRFTKILNLLQFDEENTEGDSDSFASMLEIWNTLLSNSRSCYIPANSLTVDELLYPMKCRCSFRMFTRKLPEKFGIKYWVLVDSDTEYILNGFPHLGKEGLSEKELHENVVMRLAEPYFGSAVNITVNNISATVKMAQKLMKKNITLVGKLKRRKHELPKLIKFNNSLYSTKFYRNEHEHTLTNYQMTKKRNILILSSKHNKISISDSEKHEPETVSYYNKNRIGGQILEKLCRKYSTRAGTRKWSTHIFYNMLDMALINSWILYKQTFKLNIGRKCFIFKLIEEILKFDEEPILLANEQHTTRRKCNVRKGCRNKSYLSCRKCRRTCCGKCGVKWYLCTTCAHGN